MDESKPKLPNIVSFERIPNPYNAITMPLIAYTDSKTDPPKMVEYKPITNASPILALMDEYSKNKRDYFNERESRAKRYLEGRKAEKDEENE